MIAVELAARRPVVPGALVLVDPGPVDSLPTAPRVLPRLCGAARGAGGEDVRREYVQDMGARDETLARWIVELMCAVPLLIATAVIRGVAEWDGAGAFALCTVPTLLLRAGFDDDFDAERLRTIKPDLEVGVTVGAGHFHQLEVPEQVNAMIERFLTINSAN